ncbi:glycosyltransferase family 4 protein [uncultured Winogradskyella sp.]|uniref:glycosyltransferase family 4 protein n=1 Tax=uncultured Winogradskyella sp. TaxID=395353 RepID=UPI00260C628F|nr:glycosyltransferase family 4 protein [uncultured Winogradskyella sp.]
MKNLLYIGNNLNTTKTNISSIQVLGGLLEFEGYNLRYASSYSNKFIRFLHMLWYCIRYAKWVDGVLIDTYSTQNFYYAFLCSLVCRLFAVPYYPILHGGNLPERLDKNPKMSASIFNNSRLNVSPSLYLKSIFNNKGFDNVVYIPNSISIDKYEVTPKLYDAIRLLWVRSFSEIYNPKMAVKVMKDLKDSGYSVELCMVGPDSDGSLESVKALSKKLNVDVKFTGKLSKEQWIKLSRDYNVFINTTNYDNMPVSIIEAMALAFPVVSTNVGGLPFLIDNNENGLLVPVNDVDAMVKSILRIFNNKDLRHQLSTNARQKVECFDWEVIKTQWYSIFKPN